MQISTSYLFDRALKYVTKAQDAVATSQAQLSTGKRLLAPSDDPATALTIGRIESAIARQESFAKDLQSVQQRYQVEETAMRSVMEELTKLKQLALQGANPTYSEGDRAAIAAEMRSIRNHMLQLVNVQDRDQQYVFGGTRVGLAPFAEVDGRVVYQGDQTPVYVTTGDQRLQQFNLSGTDVFGGVVRTADGVPSRAGFFDVLDDAIAAVRDGNKPLLQRGVSEVDKVFIQGTLSIAELGGAMSNIDSQTEVTNETVLRLKAMLSNVEDLDYAAAASQLSKQMLALEAAMSSFSKISDLNLFKYISQ